MNKNTPVHIHKLLPYEATTKLRKKIEVLLKKNISQEEPPDKTHTDEATLTGEVVIAETKSGKLIGIACLWPLQFLDKRDVIITLVVVDDEYRKKGIGTKLVKTLLEEAKENGAKSIIALGPIKDEISEKFYQSLGGTPHLLGYSLPLT